MKSLKFIFVFLAALGIAISCSDDKGFFDKDAIVYAAYLNVVTTGQSTFGTVSQNDFRLEADPTKSKYEVTLEERDVERGKLFASVDVYGTIIDNTPADGLGADTDEELLFSIPAADFALDAESGYPRYDVSVTAQDVLDAFSLTNNDVYGGDQVEIRFELVMKDGRKFSKDNASSIVTGGAFFNSPFFYRIPVVCASDRAGLYDVVNTPTPYGTYYDATPYIFTTEVVAAAGAGQYNICDLSGGVEPDVWGNGGVFSTIQDLCGNLSLVATDRDEDYDCAGDGKGYNYAYFVDTDNSFIDLTTGEWTLVWANEYGENGVAVYTPSGGTAGKVSKKN